MSETNNKNLNNNDTESQGIPKWVFFALLAVILGVIAFAVIKLFIWNLGTAETEKDPRPAQCHTKRVSPSLFFPVGKRAQVGHPAPPVLWDTSWEAHSGLTSQGSLGKSVELNHLETLETEKGMGSQQPVLRSWGTTFLLIVVPEQRPQPVALSMCRGKFGSPIWHGGS